MAESYGLLLEEVLLGQCGMRCPGVYQVLQVLFGEQDIGTRFQKVGLLS